MPAALDFGPGQICLIRQITDQESRAKKPVIVLGSPMALANNPSNPRVLLNRALP